MKFKRGSAHSAYSTAVADGFTLIELLVVVAIIGVLASVVLSSLNSARAKAQDTKQIADLRAVQTALAMYYADNGSYPGVSGTNYINLDPSESFSVCGTLPFGKGSYAYWSNVFDSSFTSLYISTLPLDTYSCYSYRVTLITQTDNCYDSSATAIPINSYYYYMTFDAATNLSADTYPSYGSFGSTRRCILGPAI